MLKSRYSKLTTHQKIVIGSSLGGFFVLGVLLSIVFHERIINWAKPLAEKYTQRPGGFLVPSILLMIVSIPPLFGYELISFLTGFVYGNLGFLIVVISTTLGESLLFLSFRHFFTGRLASFRAKYKDYDIFVRVIEEGGSYMIFAIRCSAIPSHFSTPLFASIEGIEFRSWLLCCLGSSFSLYPPVYFGWLLKRGESSSATGWLLTIGLLSTVIVGLYIYIQYRRHKAAHMAAIMDDRLLPDATDEFEILDEDVQEDEENSMGRVSRHSQEFVIDATKKSVEHNDRLP